MKGARVLLVAVLAVAAGFLAADAAMVKSMQCQGRARTFLMGFLGHSGSSAMMTQLYGHSHLDVNWPLEPLESAENSTAAGIQTLQIFERTMTAGTGKIPGFKLRPAGVQGDVEYWKDLVGKYDVRFIALSRTHLFKAAIGLYTIRVRFDLSAQMGLKAKEADDHCKQNPESCYFAVDNIRFFAFLMHLAHNGVEQMAAFSNMVPWKCKLHITYEEYVKDSEKTMRRVYDFLGIPEESHQATYKKALSDSPCVTLLNYQEVCALLWGCTKFRPYLEDPDNGCYCSDKTRQVDENLCDMTALRRQGPLVCQERDINGRPRAVACDPENRDQEQLKF